MDAKLLLPVLVLVALSFSGCSILEECQEDDDYYEDHATGLDPESVSDTKIVSTNGDYYEGEENCSDDHPYDDDQYPDY